MLVMGIALLGVSNSFFLLTQSARDPYCVNPDGTSCEVPEFGGVQHLNTYRSDNRFYDSVFVRVCIYK